MAEVIFNDKPGELYDIFQGLWTMANYDIVEQRKMELGIEEDNEYEEILNKLIEDKKIDEKVIKKYFHVDTEPEHTAISYNIWKYPNLDDYLEYLCNLDELEIRKRIAFMLKSAEGNSVYDEEEERIITSTNENLLEYIMDKDISSGLKWEIYLMLNDTKGYIKEFAEFIYQYSKDYKWAMKTRNDIVEDLNIKLKENIKDNETSYLNQVINRIVNLEVYKKIFVTTSAVKTLYIGDQPELGHCYLVIGTNLEDVWDSIDNRDMIEGKLELLRDVLESTRFKIIKLLLEREYYVQEIAEALDLSNANVSYHMRFLLKSKVVIIEKVGQRNYYFLNKDKIKDSYQSIKEELDL